MIKKLTKHGNSYALVIEKPVMDLLNIGADTELRVTTNGKKLVIEPVSKPLADVPKVEEATNKELVGSH